MTQFILRSAKVAVIAIIFAFAVSGQTTFAGNGSGQIPDSTGQSSCQSPGAPLDVTFNVTGISNAPSSISLSMTFSPNHAWGGDVTARLISPDSTSFVIFGHTGVSTNDADDGGDGSDLVGPYTFDDTAANNWWNAAATTGDEAPIASGIYRTSAFGGLGSSGAVTNLNAAFAGIPTSNGTWTLRFTDGCVDDTGGVGSASLTLAATSATPPQKPNVDMNGDGKSDFVVIRLGEGGSLNGLRSNKKEAFSVSRERRRKAAELNRMSLAPSETALVWWIKDSVTLSTRAEFWGDAALLDTPVSADFDGDQTDDLAIWRPTGDASTTGFYWVNSLTNTFAFDAFGDDNDDPTVVGDYDGDGIDDRATFRCPLTTAGVCYYFFRSSENPGPSFNYSPWGFGTIDDFFPCPGDYDGDRTTDLCIQRTDPDNPSAGQFVFRRSTDGQAEYVSWGAPLDFIIPGDFDGDGRSDFCVRREEEDGYYFYYILERDGGGTGASGISWGNGILLDVDVPGDYDGDGIQDIAIWRPEDGVFWVRQSSGGIRAVAWGAPFDTPLANWYVR